MTDFDRLVFCTVFSSVIGIRFHPGNDKNAEEAPAIIANALEVAHDAMLAKVDFYKEV